MQRFIYILLPLLLGCDSKNSDFKVKSCYETKLPADASTKDKIVDLVSMHYEPTEEVFVIEAHAPSFRTAILFSIENRKRAFKFNFYNNRIDTLTEQSRTLVENINIKDFIELIEFGSEEGREISKFTTYQYYSFQKGHLVNTKSRVNTWMQEDLMKKNNLKEIYDVLDSYGDMRPQCDNGSD